MEENRNFGKKQVAYRASIKDLLTGTLNEGDEWQPSFIEHGKNKISKVNLIGVVVSKDDDRQGIMIDDGTASIRVINFGTQDLTQFEPGQVLTVIGRIRTYSGERYISSEIVAKTNEKIMKLRKLELEKESLLAGESEEAIDEEVMIGEDEYSRALEIRNLIREIDAKNSGNGADIEEITAKSKVQKTEDVINDLLQAGEIFEIRPGKFKVLE